MSFDRDGNSSFYPSLDTLICLACGFYGVDVYNTNLSRRVGTTYPALDGASCQASPEQPANTTRDKKVYETGGRGFQGGQRAHPSLCGNEWLWATDGPTSLGLAEREPWAPTQEPSQRVSTRDTRFSATNRQRHARIKKKHHHHHHHLPSVLESFLLFYRSAWLGPVPLFHGLMGRPCVVQECSTDRCANVGFMMLSHGHSSLRDKTTRDAMSSLRT